MGHKHTKNKKNVDIHTIYTQNIIQILNYYLFQKKIKNYLCDWKNLKDTNEIKKGHFIHPDWIEQWKDAIGYDIIKRVLLDELKIESKNLNEKQKQIIIGNLENQNYLYDESYIYIIKNNDFMSVNENIISFKSFENFLDDETFKSLNFNQKIKIEQIEYIFKQKFLILFYSEFFMMKILFFDDKNKEIINIKFITDFYKEYSQFFTKMSSSEILKFLSDAKIFDKEKIEERKNNKLRYYLLNVNKAIHLVKISKDNNQKGQFEIQYKIKNPSEINYDLLKIASYRGLDNVGATCYMNATLQCLVNIKPITEYLLNKEKYTYLFNNADICMLTLKYTQVLIGLFCHESRTGSYSPEDFKKIISEYNPLFEGVKANDSKDLIIFLLEVLNNELIKIHNKKYNISNDQNNNIPIKKINISDQNEVYSCFRREFKKNHLTVIGNNLCGCQKSVFICQYCGATAFNFNVFNFLIFSLESTSNYFNLSYNNSAIPFINFEHCFKFLSKEESFNDTYCQSCGRTGNSKYKETIYTMPKYLIIILNRGKGNIFHCKVDIPKKFNTLNYVEKENCTFKLIGIVSHFGESGMGGHFIAFCEHNIDKKWRCYNDSIVTECKDDYLQKGTPYILFYEKENINVNNNSNKSQDINIVNNNFIPQFNINNQYKNNFGSFYGNNSQQNNNIYNNMINNTQQNNINMNYSNHYNMLMNNYNNMNLNNNFSPNINMNNYLGQNMNMNLSNNFGQNMNMNNY